MNVSMFLMTENSSSLYPKNSDRFLIDLFFNCPVSFNKLAVKTTV